MKFGKALDMHTSMYNNILLIGDFNEKESEPNTLQFLENYNLKNLVKEPTCYKNPQNPSCIDLILTNKSNNFKNTTTFDLGLSDFHKMVITSFRFQYKPGAPKVTYYRSYKNFSKPKFKEDLEKALNEKNCESYDVFEENFLKTLEKHAPLKRKRFELMMHLI